MHEIAPHDKQRRLILQAGSAIAMGFVSMREALAQAADGAQQAALLKKQQNLLKTAKKTPYLP